MATLHVRNVPDDLYAQLKQLATQERRSINAQVLTILERVLSSESSENSKQY